MKRLLADTNFYGLLARDLERLKLVEVIVNSHVIVVYGNRIIRNELRDIPKKIKFRGKSVRIDILNLYDQIVKEHILEINDRIIEIADSYYKSYREFGGSKSRDTIIDDFRIVACASFHAIDVVVSSDERSMLTENAIRAYKLVNSIVKKRNPTFIDFISFKNYLGGGKSNEFV